MSENEVNIDISDKAIEWIARTGYDPQYGARPIK